MPQHRTRVSSERSQRRAVQRDGRLRGPLMEWAVCSAADTLERMM